MCSGLKHGAREPKRFGMSAQGARGPKSALRRCTGARGPRVLAGGGTMWGFVAVTLFPSFLSGTMRGS